MRPASPRTPKLILACLGPALILSACKKDDGGDPPAPTPAGCSTTPTACGTVTDIDGNTYTTVQIGSQCWMAGNLRAGRYRNGDTISTGLSDTDWMNTTSGAFAVYGNDPAIEAVYGKLYNWYALADPRGVCPSGWHVPTDDEWKALELSLGMPADQLDLEGWRGEAANVGGKLKATSHWLSPNSGANNCSGMRILPAGGRGFNGVYTNLGCCIWLWAATEDDATHAYIRYYFQGNEGSFRSRGEKYTGFACRCVAD